MKDYAVNNFAGNVHKRRTENKQPTPALKDVADVFRTNPDSGWKSLKDKISYELDKAGFGEYHYGDYNSAAPIKPRIYDVAVKQDEGWMVEFCKDAFSLSKDIFVICCAGIYNKLNKVKRGLHFRVYGTYPKE